MNPKIYLCCLVVLIGSLVWSASAEDDFETERTRVLEIYGDKDVDQATKERNAEFLAEFLDKYAAQLELTPELRTRVNDALSKYKEDKAKQQIVDGAPAQGGWFSKLARTILVQAGIEVAIEGIKKAIS